MANSAIDDWVDAPAPTAAAHGADDWQDMPAAKPEQSVMAGVKELGHQMNPVEIGKNIWQTVSHPIEAAKSYLSAKQKMVTDAEESLSKGDFAGFVRHMQTAAFPIPGVDVQIEQASNKWDSGDKAGALGDAAALTAQLAIAPRVPGIAKGTAAGLAAAGPDLATGAAKIIGGEALAKLPGMEWPARLAMGYPGARQVASAMGKFGKAFKGAGEAAAPEAAAASAETAPVAAKTLADGTTVADILKGQGVKGKPTPDQMAGAQSIFDKLKAAEQGQSQASAAGPSKAYSAKAAEAPPSNPASVPSASAQPASAATPEATEPQPASTAESVAKATAAKAKGDRFVAAIQQYNAKNTVAGVQPITADTLATLDDAGKSVLTRALIKIGYLKNTETFTDTSFPYILQGLRASEAAAARQTIRPPSGFSMGAMKNY